MRLNDKELCTVIGGAISASFLNAIARGVNVFYNLGRYVGSTIRRIGSNSVCPL